MKKHSKICVSCGRVFQWRKKWQKNWYQVKYCSQACRKKGLSDVDNKLEDIIISLLTSRRSDASICPSEVARKLWGDDDEKKWRPWLEPIRRAARRLAHEGKISILQAGKPVDPSRFRGPIRLKIKQ